MSVGERAADILVRDQVVATFASAMLTADANVVAAYFGDAERHGEFANYRMYYMEDRAVSEAVDRIFATLLRASNELDVFSDRPAVLDAAGRFVTLFENVIIHVFPDRPETWRIQEYTERYA